MTTETLALLLVQACALRRRARTARHYGDEAAALRLEAEEIALMRGCWP